VDAVVGHRDGLRKAFGLIVHAAHANGIDVAPIGFGLGVNKGVTIHLRRGRKQETRTLGQSEAERIMCTERTHLENLDGDAREIHRAGR